MNEQSINYSRAFIHFISCKLYKFLDELKRRVGRISELTKPSKVINFKMDEDLLIDECLRKNLSPFNTPPNDIRSNNPYSKGLSI